MAVEGKIHQFEGLWREFEGHGLQSLDQSYDYMQLSTEQYGLPETEQVFVLAAHRGEPMAILPLRRVRWMGARILTWLADTQSGAQMFPANIAALSLLTPELRRGVWSAAFESAGDADLVYLPRVPEAPHGHRRLFDGFGTARPAGRVYSAEFENWDACLRFHQSQDQRGRDRQEEQRLAAMGEVVFESYEPGTAFSTAYDALYSLGEGERPSNPQTQTFFRRAFEGGFTLGGRIYALELDRRPIAVRYGLAVGTQMFLLASAASTDVSVAGVSPGGMCLARAIERAFREGIRRIDFGTGMTPEKRLWCNKDARVEDRYVPLSGRGRIAARLHRMLTRPSGKD